MKQKKNWILPPFVVLLLLCASGLACGGRAEREQSSSPPIVRFLSPPAGTQMAVGNQVFFQARAFARGGLARVEFAVNGSSVGSQALSGDQRLYVATQAWTPSAAGTYTLAATAYDTSGQASSPAQVTITVRESFAPSGGQSASDSSGGQSSGGEASGQQSGADAGVEAGEAESGDQSGGEQEGDGSGGGPEPFVDFRADRTQLQAGESTILRWDVENVREVYLDGQPVTGHETREVWPFPPAQTYILHVVLLSGEAQDYGVTIEVQGEIQLVSGPDLVVLAVDAPDRMSDEPVPFQAEVLNAGDQAARDAEWAWSVNRSGTGGPSTLLSGGTFDLEVGQTTLLRGEAPPQSRGNWTIYIQVSVDGDDNPDNNRGSDCFESTDELFTVLSVWVTGPGGDLVGCPARVDLWADIEVDSPGTVRFRYERSDGLSEDSSAVLGAGTTRLSLGVWVLREAGTYWVQLHTLEPNQISSNRLEFTLTCE